MDHVLRFVCAAWFVGSCGTAAAESWDRFRGPNGGGVAVGDQPLPTEIGPETNVVWKTALPKGHSSPVVFGNRIFLTAVDGEKLLTIAVDRETGRVLWQAESPYEKLEKIHSIGSYAQPSAAADEDVVVSFFGSSGLAGYSHDGRMLWNLGLGPFKNTYGVGSSPILVGDLVILNQDHDLDSFLLAVNKRTGEVLWKTERSEFPRGFSTPVLWENGGRLQIVVAGALRVAGYDVETGKEEWTASGLARIATMSPIVAEDGTLIVAEWAPGGDEGERIVAEPTDGFFSNYDKDKSGTVVLDELPDGPLRTRFSQIDRDKNGGIARDEYDWMQNIFNTAKNVVVAIEPGGRGDITASHVLWSDAAQLPYVPSPVCHRGLMFMVKNGGIFSARHTATGKMAKVGRVSDTGQYYASPVAGDGKVYVLSQDGGLTVVSAEKEWKVLHTARFGEETFATPALVEGKIYLRTAGSLYCFGVK